METNVSYTIAGTFILILTALIVLGVIWLSAGLNTKEYKYYIVNMQESISGLSKDGPVEFNGVNVGKVEEMKINRENPRLVSLLLKIESDTPITMGTRAKLGMRALTGVAYILLEDKGTDMRPLLAKNGENYPVIATEPSILVRLETSLNSLTTSFQTMSKSVGSLLNKTNLRNMQDILKSGKGSMQSIEAQTIPETNEALSNISETTRNINALTNEVKDNPSIILRGVESNEKLGPGER